jgi:glycosyltransferase involved in cell wall biosynthesis
MRITVITPCYNSREFIRDAVNSVLTQDLSEWEYILVDDGSTDETPKLLAEFAAVNNQIKLIRQQNSGTCAARNRGALECSADSRYLLFLDHDDILEPNALRVLSGYLDANPKVGLTGCQFLEIDSAGNQCSSRQRSRWIPSVFDIPRPLFPFERATPFVTFYCGTGQGPFAMFRREVFERTTGWTTDFWPHEDTDMFCQMALLGEVHYLPNRLYRKRLHPASGFANAERVQSSYGLFRSKWDNFMPRNQSEATLLRKASRFYRTSFRPLRNIKVGTKAIGEFLRKGRGEQLRWAFRLYWHAIRDFIRYRFSVPNHLKDR